MNINGRLAVLFQAFSLKETSQATVDIHKTLEDYTKAVRDIRFYIGTKIQDINVYKFYSISISTKQ